MFFETLFTWKSWKFYSRVEIFLTAGGDDKGDQDDPLGHLLPRHQGQGPHQVCEPRQFRFVMYFKTHSELTLLTFQPKLSWWRGQLSDWEVHRSGQRTRGGGQVCKDLLFDPRKFVLQVSQIIQILFAHGVGQFYSLFLALNEWWALLYI